MIVQLFIVLVSMISVSVRGTTYVVPEEDLDKYHKPKSAGGNGTSAPDFCTVVATEQTCVFSGAEAAAYTDWNAAGVYDTLFSVRLCIF